MLETTICFQYWPKDKPIPDGWILARDMRDTHHEQYSILIKQINPSDTSHA